MRPFIASLILIAGVNPLLAEMVPIDWSDLIDQSAQSYDDPFLDLSIEQIDDLRQVVKLNAELAGENPSPEAGAQLGEIKAILSEQGIDSDWLISQRWVVAERRELARIAGNQAYDGKTVTLGGFAIPAPPTEDGTSTAYLVPERGMCSHVPPPPPNQMVRLQLADGWTPPMIHEPVVVTGRMHIDPSERQMIVVDGFIQMKATFSMDVAEVQTFGQPAGTEAPATHDWAKNLVDGIRPGATPETASQ
ncbi:DUF3299 domain-containing protein [Tropicimonas marinistellae]|uniref:DUF3299 domain-containing protein n=1 Tax=Tropicimonas marinistellae TaxID=1739787 RepID=UPI00082D7D9A|nr:DUF3299 domain-containing protein [Tropicimonas marinistellae]